MLGRVHSFESFGTVDGPGTRFVVFLQGCMFRCKYCHNRDTWSRDDGKLYSVEEVVGEILPYTPFIDASNGGVTVTGGEPLLQRDFVCLLFKILRFQGIHTCLDTNGYVASSGYGLALDKLMSHTDLVLLDIKQMNTVKHVELTAVTNLYTLNFAQYLHEINKPTWIRYVVVPGHTDDLDDVRQLAEFVAPMNNVAKIELLPYHALGEHKWKAFGNASALEGVGAPTPEKLASIQALLTEYDIESTV
ncbi:MAG: pyruvate formate-lyase 1-activating enzyme [Gammaproteobacteria bacterium]|nr:MAG: pyruvate formate-lyase 1-activating enzyme [Gammaproteobacteria bacterium]